MLDLCTEASAFIQFEQNQRRFHPRVALMSQPAVVCKLNQRLHFNFRLNSFTHWVIYIKEAGETDSTRSLCTSANRLVKRHAHIRLFSCRDSLIWPRSPPEIKCCLRLLQSQATYITTFKSSKEKKISKSQLCGAVQKWLSIREGHLLMISCHARQRSARWFD